MPVALTMLVSLVDFLVPFRGELEVLARLVLEGPGDSGTVASVRVDADILAELCRLGFGEVGVS